MGQVSVAGAAAMAAMTEATVVGMAVQTHATVMNSMQTSTKTMADSTINTNQDIKNTVDKATK